MIPAVRVDLQLSLKQKKPVAMWSKIFDVPGGHKWFRDREGRIAPADNSGDTPDETDDGVLILDPTRPIHVIMQPPPYSHWEPDIQVFLTDTDGDETLLGTNMDEVKALQQHLNVPVLRRRKKD